MSELTDHEIEALWKQFFSKFGYKPGESALTVRWSDLREFKPEVIEKNLADLIEDKPWDSLYLGRGAAKAPLQLCGRQPDISPDAVCADYVNKLVTFDGLVGIVSNVRPRIIEAIYQCERCLAVLRIEANPHEPKAIPVPLECFKDQGGCGIPLNRTRFKFIRNKIKSPSGEELKTRYVDTQNIDILNRKTRKGIFCSLPSYLIGKLEVGQTVRITGIVNVLVPDSRWREYSQLKYYVVANSVEDVQQNVKLSSGAAPDIKSALAPGLAGIDYIKSALELQLFGGVAHEAHDHYVRGDIHVLLVGEPGTGKTTLLRSALSLAPFGTYAPAPTLGLDGLVGEVIDMKFYHAVKGGELTLNTDGLVCIDDVDRLKDLSPLFEPLEHQTATISGYGQHKSLRAKCAVLAAGIEEKLPEPFLQRFDCVFKVAPKRVTGQMPRPRPEVLEQIRDYVAYACTIVPELTEEAYRVLDSVKGGWRDVNKVQRLAEAAARKRLSPSVNMTDIEYARTIMNSVLKSSA